MKYVIRRDGEPDQLGEVTLNKVENGMCRTIPPNTSQKVWNHSPDGYEFGYSGSGPSQLALAILLDYTQDKDLAVRHHQTFKWEFIATMGHPGGEITAEQIKTFLKERYE